MSWLGLRVRGVVGVSELAIAFIDSLTWSYRRYVYWNHGWKTGSMVISRSDAIKLARGDRIFGVWQCYGSRDEPCLMRDLIAFEIDANECLNREGLECVIRAVDVKAIKPILAYKPLTYWNGGKSIYFIIPFSEPIPVGYRLRDEWVEFSRVNGFDMQVLKARHAIRVPGTRHPRTGLRGLLLNEDLKPINSLTINRVNPFYFFTINSEDKIEGGRPKPINGLPKWVILLINYLKEHGELCHIGRLAIAEWLLYLGYSEDDIVGIFKYANDFNERITRYQIRYAYENWIKQGKPPVSCRRVLSECSIQLNCGGEYDVSG